MRACTLLALLLFGMQLLAAEPDCKVINHHTSIKVADGTSIVHHSNLIQVNNPDGEFFNPLYILYNKKEPIFDLKVQIETIDGKRVRLIKHKDIEEESAISSGSFYEDDMVKKIPLTHNVYPYRIRYEYKKKIHEFLTIARWNPYLRSSLPTENSILTVNIPQSLPVKIFEQKIKHSETKLKDGSKQLTWVVTDSEKFKYEKFSPNINDVVPFVHVVPKEFFYGVEGMQYSWESFGNWVYRLNEGRDELPESEKVKIDRLTIGAESDLEKIRILYHNLQDQTRYINVSIDIGGLQSYPASHVCRTGYGDCKALSNFLVSQLKYLGIPAFYTLVYAGARPPLFRQDFPSNQFNHVFVSVPMESDTLYLECTNGNTPFGYISDFTQNRYGLQIDEQQSKLIKIPAQEYSNVTVSRKYVLKTPGHSIPVTEVSARLSGDDFEQARYSIKAVETKERGKYMEYFLDARESDILSCHIDDKNRDSSFVILTASYKSEKYFSKMGNMTLVSPPRITFPEMEDPDKRQWPVKVYAPYCRLDTLYVGLPPNAEIKALPSDTLVSCIHGKYHRQILIENKGISLIREFELPIQYSELTEYEEFYQFIKSVKIFEEEKILYKN